VCLASAALLAITSISSRAHPHDEPEIFQVKGTLTNVDAVNRAIEVDAIESSGRPPRNVLLFVDLERLIVFDIRLDAST
jgi:hypothetical protein